MVLTTKKFSSSYVLGSFLNYNAESQSTTQTFFNIDFGQLAFQGQSGVSRITPYISTTEIDGVTRAHDTGKLQSLSAMPVYVKKSHEELRWEDYQLGDKDCNAGNQATTSTYFSTSSGQSAFPGQRGTSRMTPYTSKPEVDGVAGTHGPGNLQSISAMPAYEKKNHEELRWEDYQLGDKGYPNFSGQPSREIDCDAIVVATQANPSGSPLTSFRITRLLELESISVLPFYFQKSPEELRWEDYQLGHRGGIRISAPLVVCYWDKSFWYITDILQDRSGQPAFDGQRMGSRVIPYTDTAEVNGGTGTQDSGKLNSVSVMPVYCQKSHEELRWEDYQLGDKGKRRIGIDTPVAAPQFNHIHPSLNLPTSSTDAFVSHPVGEPTTKTDPFKGPISLTPATFLTNATDPFERETSLTTTTPPTNATKVREIGDSSLSCVVEEINSTPLELDVHLTPNSEQQMVEKFNSTPLKSTTHLPHNCKQQMENEDDQFQQDQGESMVMHYLESKLKWQERIFRLKIMDTNIGKPNSTYRVDSISTMLEEKLKIIEQLTEAQENPLEHTKIANKKMVKKKAKKNRKVRIEVEEINSTPLESDKHLTPNDEQEMENEDDQFQLVSGPEDDRLITFTKSVRKQLFQKNIEAPTSEIQQNEETNEYEPTHEEINKDQENENKREEEVEENEKMNDVQIEDDPIEENNLDCERTYSKIGATH
ncbi:hypothetical protein GIB67_037098 [Kingdonia uniflora]|uniref:Uncharacterized protein n=1 Tax=Kingdonia uniflora TaxID=39325 RepID=A0A7J7LI24_9MAGN|nr:hypothetical protein GIB67_037098 [Kingdonia uniflora]